MDQLPPFGRTIGPVVGPTHEVYIPLVKKRSKEIESAPIATYSYGSHPRQQLDIYVPSSSAVQSNDTSSPILVFLYGGGFANGDKVKEAAPLFYKNLGYFFAEKVGLETIIIDYRLVKHGAKFPSGAEDLDTALNWINQKYSGQKKSVYIMGNSAGGMILASWLFEPDLQQSRRRLIAGTQGIKLSGAIFLAALYHFEYSSPILKQHLAEYLGDNLDDHSAVASLQKCESVGELTSSAWPSVLIIDSELDPEDIIKSGQEFLALLKKAGNIDVTYLNVKGHNHISPPLALGTAIPEEEEWAYRLVAWLKR